MVYSAVKSNIKATIRDTIAGILSATGISHYNRLPNTRLLALTFHRVLPNDLRALYPLPGLVVTPEELHWIIEQLSPYFQITTISHAYQQFQDNAAEKPLLALTFDDGQLDNLLYAAPVLEKLGVPATFYLPTAYIDQPDLLWHDRASFAWCNDQLTLKAKQDIFDTFSDPGTPGIKDDNTLDFIQSMKGISPEARNKILSALESSSSYRNNHHEWARLMTWQEVEQLTHENHEIGSHAVSHSLLPQLSRDEQQSELQESFDVISEKAGVKPISFCYPNGDYNQTTLELLESSPYQNAVTTQWGINTLDQNKFQLLRCDMDASRLLNRKNQLSTNRLKMRLSGYQPGL